MKSRFSLLCLLAFLVSCSGETTLRRETDGIRIDGRLDEPAWERHLLCEGLLSPWVQAYQDRTSFYACIQGERLCFAFSVCDTTPVVLDYLGEQTVEAEDRVELFFDTAQGGMQNYYCAEMDPQGWVLDYRASYYRRFDAAWNFRSLEIRTVRSSGGYVVEGAVALSELQELGIGRSFRMGIFRADFDSSGRVVWLTRCDPRTAEPDFHLPAAMVKCRY